MQSKAMGYAFTTSSLMKCWNYTSISGCETKAHQLKLTIYLVLSFINYLNLILNCCNYTRLY